MLKEVFQPKLKVAVVGGGWAGLSAAVELSSAGAAVTVFEAAKQLGGRARSVSANGRVLDNGQHILLGAYGETLRLMRKVGVDPECVFKRLPLELNYPGAGFRLKLPRVPAPFNLALGLLAAGGCTLREKTSAARFMSALRKNDYLLAADITVAELLDRHRQHGTLRRLMWEPLCLAALNTPAEKSSAQVFANVLRDSLGGRRADTDLLLPATDLSRIFPQAAAAFLGMRGAEIHLSTRVDALTPALEIDGQKFDRIVLATAPHQAGKLLAGLGETAAFAKMAAGYRYEPITTVYVGYPGDVRLPFAMLGLDDGDRGTLGQWVFDRGALGGTPGLLAFVLSAHDAPDDSATLSAALHVELEKALRTALPPPQWHCVIREKRAAFSCRPNLPRPAARTPLAGLWLAGDYVCAGYPATLEGAVRSGIAAAVGIVTYR